METRRIIGYSLLTTAAISFGLNLFAKKEEEQKFQFKDAENDESFQRDHNGIPIRNTKK